MTIAVNIIRDSIGIKQTFDDLLLTLEKTGNLVKNLNSDFISFFQASDFNELDPEFYTRYNSYEVGVLLRAIFDNDIGRADISDSNEADILDTLHLNNGIKDNVQNLLLSLNGFQFPDGITELIVIRDKDIINKAYDRLKHFKCTQDTLGSYIKGTFKNLIFHDDFNSMGNIDGGYQNFQKEIIDFLYILNFIDLQYGAIAGDIKNIDAQVTHIFCEEGGGKGSRKQGELKRNFTYENQSFNNVNCEFHYKLENMDGQYGGKHFKNRIYVGFVKTDTLKKVLIAHIGEHL